MSNFSFFHSVFFSFGELSAIYIKLKIVIGNLFHFGRVKNLSFGKVLKRINSLKFLLWTKGGKIILIILGIKSTKVPEYKKEKHSYKCPMATNLEI